MSSGSQVSSTPKVMFWAGWIISILPVFGLIMSSVMKFTQPKDLVDGFEKFGFPLSVAVPLGVVELVCTALYAIPQTAVLGAILLTGYLGGATATHVRISDAFAPPIIMGVMLWLGLYLRDARLRALLPFRR
ncbi:MAG: rane protein [Planctomycetaceae bacterium]|nr:rane protein [Planctomycetaceae bacterium]